MRRPDRTETGFRGVQVRRAACVALLAAAPLLHAQDDTLGAAEAMVKDGRYRQAYELLAPSEAAHADEQSGVTLAPTADGAQLVWAGSF